MCSDIYIIITGTTSDKKFPFADCGAWEIIHGGREFFRLKQENEQQGKVTGAIRHFQQRVHWVRNTREGGGWMCVEGA